MDTITQRKRKDLSESERQEEDKYTNLSLVKINHLTEKDNRWNGWRGRSRKALQELDQMKKAFQSDRWSIERGQELIEWIRKRMSGKCTRPACWNL